MKFRTDFVTNSSSSSFIFYTTNDQKVRSYLEGLDKTIEEDKLVEVEIENLLDIFDHKSDAVGAIKYLNKQYNLQLSKEDIITAISSTNYGEFTQILIDEYGIIVDSYLDTSYSDDRCSEIVFFDDVAIMESALDEITMCNNIKRFVNHYGFCKASSDVVKAYYYYLTFQRKGKTNEEIIDMLGEFALMLNER